MSGGFGIILGLLLSLISLSASAQPVCAKGYISLRKTASASGPVSWKVAKYMPFLMLEKKNGWAKLQDLEGEIHYAKLTDLNTKDRCVVVKVNVAVLRQKPSNTAPPAELRTVDKYTPFLRIENENPSEWLEVMDETGSKAFIHENYVWKPVVVNSFSF